MYKKWTLLKCLKFVPNLDIKHKAEIIENQLVFFNKTLLKKTKKNKNIDIENHNDKNQLMMMIIVIKKYTTFIFQSVHYWNFHLPHIYFHMLQKMTVGKLLDCFQIPLGRGTQEFFMRK